LNNILVYDLNDLFFTRKNKSFKYIMGAGCRKSIAGDMLRPFIAPPSVKKTFTINEIYDILYSATKCIQIIMWDECYDAVDVDDIKRFLPSNINNDYKLDAYDCDDFSISLCARARDWAWNRNGKKGGLAFGIITGDLRFKATDPGRPHAACFFIDSDKKLHIVDGMYNHIHELPEAASVWTIII
jgi:hypothetical protein